MCLQGNTLVSAPDQHQTNQLPINQAGYRQDGAVCADMNECITNPCPILRQCENTLGSYRCGCIDGYQEELQNIYLGFPQKRNCYNFMVFQISCKAFGNNG